MRFQFIVKNFDISNNPMSTHTIWYFMITKSILVGFTLIELLIAIAVIGLLAAIALPNYIQYIGNAQRNACLAEVKGYSDHVFYMLNDQNDSTQPTAPVTGACQSITDATGWTLDTWSIIEATAKPPSNARIECDVPNGSPCRILP